MKVKEGDIVAYYFTAKCILLFECEKCDFVINGLLQQFAVFAVPGSVVALHVSDGQVVTVMNPELVYYYSECRKATLSEIDAYQRAIGV